MKNFHLLLAAVLILLTTFGYDAHAEDNWFLGLYGGRATSSDIEEIFLLKGAVTDAYIGTVFVGKELGTYRDFVTAELEGQVAKYSGDQDHWEFNGLFTLRWLPFFWDDYLDTSAAIGGGLSYATEKPKVEIERNDETEKLLFYLMMELSFKIPSQENWSVFGRLHHRSGVFGTFNGVHGGSNILAAGVRYTFD